MFRYFVAVIALLIAAIVACAAFLAISNECATGSLLPRPFSSSTPNGTSKPEAGPKNAPSRSPVASFELQLSDPDKMEGRIYAGSSAADRGEWLHRFVCDIKVGEFAVAVFAFFLVVFIGLLWGGVHKLWVATREVAQGQKRDTEVIQRAYLSAYPAGVNPFDSAANADGHVGFRNAGRVPARKVRWFIDVATSSDFQRAHFPIGQLNGNNSIPSDSEIRQWGRTAISRQEFDNFQANSLWVYVWGTVHYDDGFGNERYTNFCHRYDARGFRSAVPELSLAQAVQLGRAAISSEGAVYHRYGNDAD